MKQESPLNPLLKQIDECYPLTGDLRKMLTESVQIRYYPEQFVVLQKNEEREGLFFMLKGMALAEAPKEKATRQWLAGAGQLITPAMRKFRQQVLDPFEITVLEDSFVANIRYENVCRIIDSFPGFEQAAKSINERFRKNMTLQEKLLGIGNPAERLQKLRAFYPGIENRLGAERVSRFLHLTVTEVQKLLNVFSQ